MQQRPLSAGRDNSWPWFVFLVYLRFVSHSSALCQQWKLSRPSQDSHIDYLRKSFHQGLCSGVLFELWFVFEALWEAALRNLCKQRQILKHQLVYDFLVFLYSLTGLQKWQKVTGKMFCLWTSHLSLSCFKTRSGLWFICNLASKMPHNPNIIKCRKGLVHSLGEGVCLSIYC